MPTLHLTELSVRALKGSDGITYYWDTSTPAFGIRVGKRAKAWTVIRGRNRERLTIGRYPAMKLSDARTEAKKLLATDGGPKTPSVRLSEARTAFLATYTNPKTRYQVKRALERHFKGLEQSLASDITHADIERALDKLADRPSEQLHAFRYLRALFNWSAKAPRRWVTVSPMHGYDPPGSDKKGSRTLTDAELRRIWLSSPGIFRLMILWGTRNTETCVLEREWLRDGVMTIPGAVTKNGRDHAIPVLPIADQVLSTSTSTSNQYVFPGRWGEHITPGALGKLKRQVIKDSCTKGWQLRDLRRTFRSNMARLGVSREVCEVLINHAPTVLDEIYDRYDRLAEKRDALRRYEHFLVWLLSSRD